MRDRIIVLSRSLPFHGLGGMEVVAWDLSRELSRMGYPVEIITTSLPGGCAKFEQDDVTVVPLDGVPPSVYSSSWWRRSREYFERNCMGRVSAVLSVSAAGFGLLPLTRELRGIPFIMQAHGTSWGEVVAKWKTGRLRSILASGRNLAWLPKDLMAYRKFDAVVAVGERVYRDLSALPPRSVLPARKLHLINNGIDTSVFFPSDHQRRMLRQRLGIAEKTPVVISASRLHGQKGVHLNIRAFAELCKEFPEAIYLIAGDGAEKARLEALAAELGIGGSIRFLGALQRTSLADYLRASDVFLFLTEHIEGLPLNVLEALASGIPAVVSEHLCLFESPWIKRVCPYNPSLAAELLGAQLGRRAMIRANALPEQYELGQSATAYAKLMNLSGADPRL